MGGGRPRPGRGESAAGLDGRRVGVVDDRNRPQLNRVDRDGAVGRAVPGRDVEHVVRDPDAPEPFPADAQVGEITGGLPFVDHDLSEPVAHAVVEVQAELRGQVRPAG